MTTERDQLLAFAEKLVLERVRRGDHATVPPVALRAWAVNMAIDLYIDLGKELQQREQGRERAEALDGAVMRALTFLGTERDRWRTEDEIFEAVPLEGFLSLNDLLVALRASGRVEWRYTTDIQKRRVAHYTREEVPWVYRLLVTQP